MKFTVEYRTKFTLPYWGGYVSPENKQIESNKGKIIKHESCDIYSQLDRSTFEDVLREVLDYPDKEMSEEDVHRDFGSSKIGKIEDKHVKEILEYYNGRRALALKVLNDVKKALLWHDECDADDVPTNDLPTILHYDIPESMNTFNVYDEPSIDGKEKQELSYIKITIDYK